MPKIDWKTLAVIVSLLGNFALLMWKGGQLVERLNNVQTFQQQLDKRMERIENMFLARPGGTP